MAPAREIRVVWALFGVVGVAMLVTYWRLPPAELYHVSRRGFDGGAGRVVVFLGFPTALAAVAILGFVYERLRGRWALPVSLTALVLCASVARPGVVDEANLDVKWSNAFAAAGTATVLVLSIVGRAPLRRAKPSRAGDLARVGVAVVAAFAALPWMGAELGFFLDRVPALGSFFITGKIAPEPGGQLAHTVHHGHHHGMDGLLLTLTALLLSRLLGSVRSVGLRTALGAYLSLMLVYGLTNMVNDFWSEQVVKRGWTGWEVPSVLHPTLSLAWLAMLAAATLIYAAFISPRALLARSG
jgi:hypothetical protein